VKEGAFLIAGCQRSGTTLLRLLLESHPTISCVDEMLSYTVLSKTTRSNSGHFVGYKIPIWTEQLDQAMLRPNELEPIGKVGLIPNFYSGQKILFMVRSPLDVVASMRQLRVGEWQWLEHVCRPVMEAMLQEEEFRRSYAVEIEQLRNSAIPDVGLGALYWKWKTSALLRYLGQGLPVHPVIYEQLIFDPEAVMREVLMFLGIEWHPNVLMHHRRSHSQLIEGIAIGGTDAKRALDGKSLGKWRSVLTTNERDLVLSISAPLSEDLKAIPGWDKAMP
jgi:hypothetical protein